MSLNEPLKIEYLSKGYYGIVMKIINNNIISVVKQFYVQMFDYDLNSLDNEVNFTKKAYNYNNDIFIKIIKDEISVIDLAKTINKKVPLINNISINEFGYIYMEYMNLGDLFNFLLKDYTVCNFDITGILGCYLNGLYILHNKLNIIHGDLTPMNILVTYMGSTYRQKIIYDNKEYYINTNGYKYNISDFGLAEYIEEDDINNTYINHIYRDYLLLFFLYFNKTIFYNYNMFSNIIELCVEQIKDNLFESYGITDKYKKHFLENNNFTSVCNFMNQYLEIDYNDALFYDIPKILLKEFIELTVIDKK